MRRTKVHAPTPMLAPTVKPEGRGRVVSRAAAGPPPKPVARFAPKPVRAANTEVNHAPDYVAAVLVPTGQPAATGRVVPVPPGGSYTAPPGIELRAFIHRDGSAVKFAGAAGQVYLHLPEAVSEFGPLHGAARQLLAAPTPAPTPIQRAAEADAASGAGAAEAVASATRTSGKPLPTATRSKLESSFGADLGAVRVHTDSTADTAARSVQAHAFATGTDVFFRAGQYRPDTPAGEKLLAHEVAHTVQQGSGTPMAQRKAASSELQISEPGDALEVQADQAAERAVRNEPARLEGPPARASAIARFAMTAPTTTPSPAAARARKGVPDPSLPQTLDPATRRGSGPSALGRTLSEVAKIAQRAAEQLEAEAPRSEESTEPEAERLDAPDDTGRQEPASIVAPTSTAVVPDQIPPDTARQADGTAADAQRSDGEQAPARNVRSEGTLESFGALTASEMAMKLPSLGKAIANQFGSDRAAVVDTTPKLNASIPGQVAPDKAEAGPAAPSEFPSAQAIAPVPVAADAAAAPALDASVPPQPDGTAISTTAGPPPQFVPGGESNPNQVGITTDQASRTIRQGQQSIAAELAANRSANRIVPVGVDRREGITLPGSKSAVNTTASEEMRGYLETDVPSGVRAIADSDLAPTISASLSAPRQAVAKAALDRDVQRERALAEAQAEADRASLDARVEQNRLIADGRNQIEAAKADAVKESQDKLDAYDRDAQQLKETHQKEIQQTIDTQQGLANSAIANGEAQAAQQQATADAILNQGQPGPTRAPRIPWMPGMRIFRSWNPRKTFDEGVEAVSDAGGKVVNAAKRGWDSLSDTAKQAFEAAKNMAKEALEKAKSVAVGIIEGLKTTVAGMIRGFGEALKVLAAPLLVFFPQLRTRVNDAIDGVVDATTQLVNKVAEGLENTVTALVNKVSSVVNRILDTFELVVVTSIALAQALLTGNFLDAAKILFLAACKALGIPGEEFLGILADAGGALLDIIKHPASFLGSLIKSVGGGMGKFMANFAQRMIGGVTEWLFGKVAEGGITLPTSFGPEGIFMLLLQVMGITYAHIRERVVLQLGEKAVSTIEKVMTPIEIMFTKGPGALWAWLKDQAEQAKKAIIEAASQWLITQIITQAAIKLASMFTPVGAFVQAVLMMYNTIMFFVEKIKEIFAWVKSITASLKNIAVGAIGAAVDYIDQSMAKSIPLIIEFLAKLLGVGGIGEQIRKVVQTLRGPVDTAIDFLIAKLVAGAKAAWGGIRAGAKRLSNWWESRKTFTNKRGEKHSLYYAQRGGNTELMVASDEQPVDTFLQKQKAAEQSNPAVDAAQDEQSKLKQIEASGPESPQGTSEKKAEAIDEGVQRMADCMKAIAAPSAGQGPLPSNEDRQRMAFACGMTVEEFNTHINTEDDLQILSLVVDLTPLAGQAKAGYELFTGTDPVTETETSRWWAAVGVIPWSAVLKKVPRLVPILERLRLRRAQAPSAASIPQEFLPASAVIYRYSKEETEELIRFWEKRIAQASTESQKATYRSYIDNLRYNRRPSPRQSEAEVQYLYQEIGYTPEVPFKNGQPTARGESGGFQRPAGHTRPDVYGSELMVEVKNYELVRGGQINRSRLGDMIRKLKQQIGERFDITGYGRNQSILLDLRGQGATSEQIAALVETVRAELTQHLSKLAKRPVNYPLENIQVLY